MSDPRDDRLVELARRVLAGDAIDWDAAMREDPSIVGELRRLQLVVAAAGQETGTAVAEPATPPEPPSPPPRKKSRQERFIGDFRVVRTLGEGGMGIVYEAEQQHPRRPVALKVVRGGAHVSPETLKLFEREAQTLARLRHPGIAQLYETGGTDDGLHFFAMELVRGETLGEWLKKRPHGPITPAELKVRVGLFRKICDAVAYAHQKGVIHRDLKPGNVLIPTRGMGSSIPDLVPDVKVLDFGLARITESDVQVTTYVTEMGKVQGTLPYMSPEQVRGNPDEIDQRTDVYSLGVMLYELMTGRLPYDLSKAQLPEAVRIICEQPPRSMVTTFTGTRRLDADLSTIVGKALEKEPARRYQSVAALGEDVSRWLNDQPILARPPSAAYQLRKLMRRNRGLFAFAASVFVLLAAFAVVMTVQAARIARERDRANQEAETARQVSQFLESLFKVVDPSESRGDTITAREILDRGAGRIEGELESQPAVQAKLMNVIARVYYGLGLVPQARTMTERALQRAESAPLDDPKVSADLWELRSIVESTMGQPGRAFEAQKKAYEIRRQVLDHESGDFARATYLMASGYRGMKRFEECEAMMLEAIRLADRNAPGRVLLRVMARRDLGGLYVGLARYADAERWMREALAIFESKLPADDPELPVLLNSLGFTLALQRQFDEARPYLERALDLNERIYGPDHPTTMNVLHSLGELERLAGRPQRAHALLERALTLATSRIGPESAATAMVLGSLAPLLSAEGRLAEAEDAYRTLLRIHQASGRGDSSEAATTLEGLAAVLRRQGNDGSAASLEASARRIRTQANQGMETTYESGVVPMREF